MKKVLSTYPYHQKRSSFVTVSSYQALRVGPKGLEIKVDLALQDGGLFPLLTQSDPSSLE